MIDALATSISSTLEHLMSRIPPGLLYLTIYNPTLQPIQPYASDDEDAEEQAHILFYTGRERAVSRDKILRQVGLAKALVNFSHMFNDQNTCENVHSQTRRMVMISPEPDFWIHACVEVSKTQRPLPTKGKAKAKGKDKDKDKLQDTSMRAGAVYDYHDGSVHDIALRSYILQGYEEFKLTHGSFSSILSLLGQHALELQIERFFTVWAWKWDVEDNLDFGDHLGVPMHPTHRAGSSLLDRFAQQHLSPNTLPFVLIPPHVIPSTRLLHSGYPAVLVRYIMSKIPPPSANTHDSTLSADKEDKDLATDKPPDIATLAGLEGKISDYTKSVANPFSNMDMRNLKWMWTGLTFGKGLSTKSTAPPTPSISTALKELDAAGQPDGQVESGARADYLGKGAEVEFDAESLQEAISENVSIHDTQNSVVNSPIPPSAHLQGEPDDHEIGSNPESTLSLQVEGVAVEVGEDGAVTPEQAVTSPQNGQSKPSVETTTENDFGRTATPPMRERVPEFVSTSVFLANPETPTKTTRKKVFHTTIDRFTFAFIAGDDHGINLTSLGENVNDLVNELRACLAIADSKGDTEISLTPVTKILEPQDQYIISTGPYTSSLHSGFSSKSEHLFDCQAILHNDLNALEVFSRGQNPQHWHLSKRGLGIDESGSSVEGEVYMEVARKESTLTDVDNELAGVVRQFTQVG